MNQPTPPTRLAMSTSEEVMPRPFGPPYFENHAMSR